MSPPFLKKGDIMTLEGEIVIRGGSKTRVVRYLDIITNFVIYHGVLKYCLFFNNIHSSCFAIQSLKKNVSLWVFHEKIFIDIVQKMPQGRGHCRSI